MSTTPESSSPDELDDARAESLSGADTSKEGGPGAEIGMVEGEGTTFEPEEDPGVDSPEPGSPAACATISSDVGSRK